MQVCSCVFFDNRKNKEILSITRNEKKKHSKIVMLTKSKLSTFKTLISKALIDLEIGHKKFKTNVKGK